MKSDIKQERRSKQLYFFNSSRACLPVVFFVLLLHGCDGCDGIQDSDTGSADCSSITCSLNEECSMETGSAECVCIAGHHICEGICVSVSNECISVGGNGSDGGDSQNGECTPGQIDCIDDSTARICNSEDPPSWEIEECEEYCTDNVGCTTSPCDPSNPPYCVDLNTLATCEEPGTNGETLSPCGLNFVCIVDECIPMVCTPGLVYCEDGDVHTCNELGTASTVEECPDDGTGSTCFQGECVSACEIAILTDSYIGCEYYSADLSNSVTPTSTANNRSFALVFANTDSEADAIVSIDSTEGNLDVVVVPPGDVAVVEVPRAERNMNLHDNETGFGTQGGNGVWERLYHITASVPIASYQFNPLETIGSAASDASLLIPTHVLDTQYLVLGYGPSGSAKPNFVIYATEEETTVTLEVPMVTPGSNTGSLVDFTALTPGLPFTFTLEPMQAFSLFCRDSSCDLTGASIVADKPIGVVAGGRGRVPSNVAYTDHMEEQLIPRQKWGSKYIIPKSRDRWGIEDRVRIMADQDETTVIFNPEHFLPIVLQEGEWTEISVFQSVVVEADKPIQIGQYLAGSQYGNNPWGSGSEGDPSFWIVPPTEQYRENYVFYAPSTYTTDYLAIMYQGSPEIHLDGALLDLGNPEAMGSDGGSIESDGGIADPIAPGTDYYVATIPIGDGAHVLESTIAVGMIVYGFGGPNVNDPNGVQNVSYGYVGGLNLVTINPKD
jgi:hypothetical protein